MQSVWKFPLLETDEQDVVMPCDARILSVQTQAEVMCIWAIVSPDAARKVRRFAIVGTGRRVPAQATYIGTTQLAGGALVFHIFELNQEPSHGG